MGLDIYYGRKDYPVKAQLYEPVYEVVNGTAKLIRHDPSDKFCWCREKDFQTTEEREQSRRKKITSGILETISLSFDEITIDWKIEYDGKIFIIESLTQKDDDKQQVMLKKCVVKTTLKVRC